MKKLLDLRTEESIVESVAAEVVKHEPFTVINKEMEFNGLSYLSAKPKDDGDWQVSSLYLYHDKQSFRFSGETADELYEAIKEFGAELGIKDVFRVDGKVACADAGGMTLILEMVEGSIAKVKTWENSKTGEPEWTYQLHKGHVTGAFAIKKRSVSFGRKFKEETVWFGRE